MLMDYKKSPTSVVPESRMRVSSFCIFPKPLLIFNWDCLKLLGQFFAFSHVTITRTFIYAVVTPTYTKESHNLCTKIQGELFLYRNSTHFDSHASLSGSANIYQ